MERRDRDFRTILLLLASIAASLLSLSIAALAFTYAVWGLVNTGSTRTGFSTLQAVVLATGFTLIGGLFLPAIYFCVLHLRGHMLLVSSPKPLKIFPALLLILLWISVSLLAQLFLGQEILKWFTPPLYLLAIATPVYGLICLAAGGLSIGSLRRRWGVFAISMAAGPTFSILAEGGVAILVLLGVGIYFGLHPVQAFAFKQITNELAAGIGGDQVLKKLVPSLNTPFAFLMALILFSGLTPFIEETAKSIAPLMIFDHLETPAQGFVVGALSGAGFGLIESLLAAATPDRNWAATLMIRGGSTMMHILTASLTGWGIASFRSGKKALPIVGFYFLAIFLHGTWNASVVMLAFGGMRMDLISNAHDPTGVGLVAFGASVLTVLCLTIPLALGTINWKLRHDSMHSDEGFDRKNLGLDAGEPADHLEGVQ